LKIKERRRFQRISIGQPIVARFGSSKVLILDISLPGAAIESKTQLKTGEEASLTFRWDDENISLGARVIRSKLAGFSEVDKQTVYNSGLLFSEVSRESAAILRQIITTYVTRALLARKSNARGVAPSEFGIPANGLGEVDPVEFAKLLSSKTFTSPSALRKGPKFVSYTLSQGKWITKRTSSPEQPADGFTICEIEDRDDQTLLCETYEKVDSEWRRMIRLFAEVSVAETDDVAPQKFEP